MHTSAIAIRAIPLALRCELAVPAVYSLAAVFED